MIFYIVFVVIVSPIVCQIRIKRVTVERFPLYGDLYKCLCSSTGEIPFAVYRTEKNTSADRTVTTNNISIFALALVR